MPSAGSAERRQQRKEHDADSSDTLDCVAEADT
jgi:hypothetical protein